MDGGAVVVVVVGEQVQGVLVARTGLLEQGSPLLGGGAGGPGVAEALEGDGGQRVVSGGAADVVLLGCEIEVTLVPALRLVEVSQPGHAQVGVAEGGCRSGLEGRVTDAFGEVVGGLKVLAAGRIILIAQDQSEELLAPGEGAQTVAAGKAEPLGGQVEVGGGPLHLILHPGMAETLLAQHRDDGTGHCTMCSDGGQRGRPIWPCTTAVAARAATTHRTDRPTR